LPTRSYFQEAARLIPQKGLPKTSQVPNVPSERNIDFKLPWTNTFYKCGTMEGLSLRNGAK
jgi:hypothetical protein